MKTQSLIPLDQLRARSTGTGTDDLSMVHLEEIRVLREENRRLRAEKHETSLAQEILENVSFGSDPTATIPGRAWNHDGHLGHEGTE